MGLPFFAWKDGTQVFMAGNHQVECLLHIIELTLAADGDGRRNIIAGTIRFELINKPQSFLGIAQRKCTNGAAICFCPAGRQDGRDFVFVCFSNQFSETIYGGVFKERFQGQVYGELTTDSGD